MSRGKRKVPTAWVNITLAVAGMLLAGCSVDRWAEVDPGEYVALKGREVSFRTAMRGSQELLVDRDRHLLVFTLADGSEVETSFVPRDKADWPSGCPSNIASTRMEVLEIAEDLLTIGPATFRHPVLVRDCPPDPVRIVLREDGVIGGGGSACSHPEPCIIFSPGAPAPPLPMPLPHSSKGYELYSWPAGKEWHFSLITGTNRLKGYEEIVSTENIVVETDWVKLSVVGVENLKAVLNLLPKGEEITWIGDGWLADAGAPESDIRLPGPKVIREVDSHCHRLGIRLQVAD